VISMGALLLLLVECLSNPAHPALGHALDMASYGRLHRRRGRLETAADYLERSVTLSRETDVTTSSLHELAAVYRKLGRVADAADIWRSECRRRGIVNITAYIELAKIYEHQMRDFQAALALISEAEQQASLVRDIGGWPTETQHTGELARLLEDFQRRRVRVERKAARQQARRD
jgi:tetratricopeptide (TPR) repeat protein